MNGIWQKQVPFFLFFLLLNTNCFDTIERMSIAEQLAGTSTAFLLEGMKQIYEDIESRQTVWKEAGAPSCIDGCGCCCVSFEPDVLESEALYLAAWLLDNEPETAGQIAAGTFIPLRSKSDKGCFLFDYNSPWHCTVYGGRCLICRLFGYSGDYGKNGERRFKPCRFLPQSELDKYGMEHRQYVEQELEQKFGKLPPAMSDCTEQALLLSPGSDGNTKPLREALPVAIRKLQWLVRLSANPNNGDQPASA
jgi:Fe-S-cluster containining protein